MLFSVIVPIYKISSEELHRALASVLNQEFKDLELILIDDGSPDLCGEICDMYKEKYENIKVFHTPNRGVSAARNTGVENASGKWIVFLDPDDCFVEDAFNTFCSTVNNSESDIFCFDYKIFTSKGIRNNCFFNNEFKFYDNNDKLPLYLQLFDFKKTPEMFTGIGVPWGKIYKRELLKDNQLSFNPEYRRMQDNVFNMYAFEKAKKIIYIKKPVYVYNISNVKKIKSKYDNKICSYYELILNERRAFTDNVYQSNIEIKKAYNRSLLKMLVRASIRGIILDSNQPNKKKKYEEYCKKILGYKYPVRTNFKYDFLFYLLKNPNSILLLRFLMLLKV